MTCRHHRQRARTKALKADAAVLLDRILIRFSAPQGEKVAPLNDREIRMINEMVTRLRPPTGVRAPIIVTGFTKGKV